MSFIYRFIAVLSVISIIESCPKIISRNDWGAKAPTSTRTATSKPVPYVVIHHTYVPKVCNTSKECKDAMKSMQNYHQQTRKWEDIGYNFCIGGDGRIYEGRGWGIAGAHAPTYNSKSVGICFIGDYQTVLPSKKMLKAADELIECGIDEEHIDENYDLIGHRQVRRTECPGQKLYEHIQKHPHWTDKNLKIVERLAMK